jgi:hypothetical protein
MKNDGYKIWFWGILIVTGLLMLFGHIRFYADRGLYGDQVHFLVITQSIIQDEDLNVKNQYEYGSYWEYYIDPGFEPIDPHLPKYKFNDQSPAWYPLHNPGLSLWITPAYMLAGAKGTIWAMIGLDILVLWLLYVWIERITGSIEGAAVGVLIMLSAPFFLNQVGYIFTDLPILTVLLGSSILLFKKDKKWWHYLLLSVMLGVGVWVHVKMMLALGTIGVLALREIYLDRENKERNKNWWAMILPSFLLVGLFEIKLFQWYGVLLPTSSFAGDQMFKINPINSLSAYLFDRSQGILGSNPAFWLVFLGLPMWYGDKKQKKRSKKQVNHNIKNNQVGLNGRKQLAYLVLILGPTFLMQLTFDDWCGGYSPAGRYMIGIWPILLPTVGFLVEKVKKYWLRIVLAILIAWQAIYSLFMIYYRAEWNLCGTRNNMFVAVENKTGWAMDKFLPVFNGMVELEQKNQLSLLIIYFLVIVLLVWAGYLMSKAATSKY